jgi:hypothetical protein
MGNKYVYVLGNSNANNTGTGMYLRNAYEGNGFTAIYFGNDGAINAGCVWQGSKNYTNYAGPSSMNIGTLYDAPLGLVAGNTVRVTVSGNGDVHIPGKLVNAGVAKAWVAFNGYDNFTPVGGETRCQIWNSYNVQKVVRVNTGQYNVHFNTAMPTTPYCVTGSCGDVQGVGNERISIYPSVMYASYFMIHSYQYNDVLGDNSYISVAVCSN